MGGSVAGVKATTTMLVVAVSISRLSLGQRTHCAVRTSIRKLAELKMELRPEQLFVQNSSTTRIRRWKSDPGKDTPDLQTCQGQMPRASAENAVRFGLPDSGWRLFVGVVRPKSRGYLRLTGPNPLDPIQIEANFLNHPDDLKAAMAGVELCREVGNSAALQPFSKREAMPGNLKGKELENFIRDGP
jgi:choline dehydrogenase